LLVVKNGDKVKVVNVFFLSTESQVVELLKTHLEEMAKLKEEVERQRSLLNSTTEKLERRQNTTSEELQNHQTLLQNTNTEIRNLSSFVGRNNRVSPQAIC